MRAFVSKVVKKSNSRKCRRRHDVKIELQSSLAVNNHPACSVTTITETGVYLRNSVPTAVRGRASAVGRNRARVKKKMGHEDASAAT